MIETDEYLEAVGDHMLAELELDMALERFRRSKETSLWPGALLAAGLLFAGELVLLTMAWLFVNHL